MNYIVDKIKGKIDFQIAKYFYFCCHFWRDGRVVECTGLENQRTAMYRGFESLSLRKKVLAFMLGLFIYNSKFTL